MALTPVASGLDLPTDAGVSVSTIAVPGGTAVIVSARSGSGAPAVLSAAMAPSQTTSLNLPLTSAKTVAGLALGAAAGTPAGAVGVARTAGTSLTLDGEATSASTKTNAAMFEFDMPAGYVANADFSIAVDASITGSGTLTAASCTMTPTLYKESAGVETAVTVGAAQQIVAAGGVLTFAVASPTVSPGDRMALSLSMAVVSSSGANTGHIRNVAIVL